MNEFLIELQAILNKEVSKGNIDKSITRLQEQIKKLQLQAEIDPKTIQNLTKEIEKTINQKITFSNITVDTGQAVKNTQKAAQQIANASVSATDTIIQNEKTKQQAYKQTADIQQQITANDSLRNC